MKVSRSAIASLSKLALRFSLVVLVISATSAASHASSLPTIAVVSGSSQGAPYASTFPKPLAVKVTNPSTKLGVPGIQVNFTPNAGLQLSASSAITDASGQASVTATGTAAGLSSATAQISGSSASVAFTKLTVSKVPLTVVPDDVQSIVGILPTFKNYSLQGFVNGESASTANIIGAPAFTTVATVTSPASTYGLRGNAGSLTAANYNFVQGLGHLTLTGVPICGNLGADTSGLLTGTYVFNLYNQQAGVTGTLTTDGTSKVVGQTFFNAFIPTETAQWSFVGSYRVGIGYRGGAALLETSAVNSTITQVKTLCFVVDNVTAGVAASGRVIEATGYNSAAAGAFYRVDGTATSVSSFNGTYILGLQGAKLDINSGNPLQSAEVATLHLDGNGNVTGSLVDANTVESNGGSPVEQYSAKQQIIGSYTFDSTQATGVITLNQAGVLTNLKFVAPSSQRLFLITQDSGSSSVPVYFGEARKQVSGPFSAAAFSGNLNFVSQGIDASQAGLVAELGGILFDGTGVMTHQGKFTVLAGNNATVQDATGSFPYTVDSTTGRFESRNPSTNACNICGYLVGPNDLVALAPGSGIPLFVTLKTAASSPSTLKLNALLGKYSVGSLALVAPQSEPFDGILVFDSKGGFTGGADTHSNLYGQINNLGFTGTYAIANGAYTLTMTGHKTPDFYLYPNTNGGGTIIPVSASEIAISPLLNMNPVIAPAIK
jgi:hypothetical protein